MGVLLIALSVPGVLANGVSSRVPPDVASLAAVAREPIPYRRDCFGLSADKILAGEVCLIGADGAPPSFVLWGDSHALALAPALDGAARTLGVAGYFLGESACPPLRGVQIATFRRGCEAFNESVVSFLEAHPEIEQVMLAARWSRHFRGSAADLSNEDQLARQGLRETLETLMQRGVRAFVIEQVPEAGWNVPSVMARARLYSRPLPEGPMVEKHNASVAPFARALADVKTSVAVRFVGLSDRLCDGISCRVTWSGEPLYRDNHHLSAAGAKFVEAALLAGFSTQPAPDVRAGALIDLTELDLK